MIQLVDQTKVAQATKICVRFYILGDWHKVRYEWCNFSTSVTRQSRHGRIAITKLQICMWCITSCVKIEGDHATSLWCSTDRECFKKRRPLNWPVNQNTNTTDWSSRKQLWWCNYNTGDSTGCCGDGMGLFWTFHSIAVVAKSLEITRDVKIGEKTDSKTHVNPHIAVRTLNLPSSLSCTSLDMACKE